MPNNIIIKPDSKSGNRSAANERGGPVGRLTNTAAESAETHSHKISNAVKAKFRGKSSIGLTII